VEVLRPTGSRDSTPQNPAELVKDERKCGPQLRLFFATCPSPES
jgi:hypothetical protein